MQRLTQLIAVLVCVVAVAAAAHSHHDHHHQGRTAAPAPVVQTVQGKLRGTTLETYTGKKILSFLGVRYAEPPTGSNRFKPPVPAKPWDGVRNATEDGPYCPQIIENIVVSEDCLFLNVYTKSLTGNQPVVIYLHPGGFSAGTGASVWGPQYFLDKDIVLVSINYRLGALGFLSTGDAVLPGNYAMKDQIQALKWIQQNIAKFGGDPQSVTVFGYSAGSSSLQLHMVSPLARGLFHRGISGSCGVTEAVVLIKEPAPLARRFARLLNCSTETSQHIRDCLLRVPHQDLVRAADQIQDALLPAFSLFGPVVEREGGDDRFLTDDPVKIFKSGQFMQIPLIAGITRDEFNWRAQFVLTNNTYVERLNREFDEIAPWEFQYPRVPRDLSKKISAAFKKFYFNDQPVSNATEKQLGQLYADSTIIFSAVQSAQLIAAKSSAPVYFYKFDFEGRYSFRYYFGTKIPYGVGHHDDLIYIFNIPPIAPMFNQTDPEMFMVRTLTSIYSDFAKSGTPTLPDTRTQWAAMTQQRPRYLDISTSLTMQEGVPYQDRMALWDSMLPIDGPYRQISY